MSQRKIMPFLTLPSIIALAALGYSCASSGTNDGAEQKAPAKPAAQVAAAPAKKTEASKPAAKPQILPTPPKLSAIAAPAEPKHLKRAEKPKNEEIATSRVMRFVAAAVLNIRAKPTTESAIVGRLVKGSQLPVEIKGEWAKIGESQFVQTKYLTPGKSMAAK